MDLILMNENNEDVGVVYPVGDFEYGDTNARNDFQLTGKELKIGYGLYVEGDECGGVIDKPQYSSTDATVFNGTTWRGLLKKDIINSPSGSDYRVVSGEANGVLASLISESEYLSAYFGVSGTTSSVTLKSYQFNLYTDYLTGLTAMCEENSAKLVIKAEKSDDDKKVHMVLSIEPAEISECKYNEDNGLKMVFTDDRSGITHLQCMGSGDLQERMRVDLYVQADGSISETQYFTGKQNTTEYYDYSNAESRQDLIDKGTERLKEIMPKKSLSIEDCYNEHGIGDKVTAEYEDISATVKISAAIVRFNGDKNPTTEYSVKEV